MALVADDDPAILTLLQAFLRSRGYQVLAAVDGEDAWQRFLTHSVDLLVTDWTMPRLNGLDLCRRVRSAARDHYTYVVMLTAQGEPGSLRSAMEAGVDDFMNKPFRPAELDARLHAAQRVLELHRDLASRNRRLEQAHQQISHELELARDMQMQQLPAPACLDRVCFDWFFEPSHYVGGDVFHYFPVDDAHVCFYAIDIAGHGVPAAMLAFHAQYQIIKGRPEIAATIADCGGDLRRASVRVVRAINRRFMALGQDSGYFTMIFGLLDARAGRLAMVQAGHPSPLYADPATGTLREIGEGGLPVGVLEDARFEATELQMARGSRLYLCSDGIPDAANANGERFAQHRLEQVLLEHGSQPLPQLRDAVCRALEDWRGAGVPVVDDISFLVMEYA
ncbi:MAG: hypothetical protein JWP36_2399 [Paucimonas sp.]|nr:hypothetical protein [Paucimonas sp.]